MVLSDRDRKILWAKAGNQCSYGYKGNNCTQKMIEAPNESDTVVGFECHIVGKTKDSARFLENYDDDKMDSYENRILLCGSHHKLVDDKNNEQIYTIKVVRKMKKEHENIISNRPMTESVRRFSGFSPSKKDLLDLDDINYCLSKLKKNDITPIAEERILSDISNDLSDISYIETLREESKSTLQNLLEFLFDYLKGKGETTLIGVLKILTWICRSEMLNSAKSIFYDYLKSLLDEKKRHYDLLEILFRFGHFEDRILWISTAIDEKNIDFINILTSDLGSPKLKKQKSKLRDILYEKLDTYEQNGESEEIVQKIHYLLEKLKNI